MVEIYNLSKKYGKNQVLDNIRLTVDEPGIYAILGPNGSGKTTLIKSILGMVLPDDGEIRFKNKSIKKQWDYRREISYLPQIARFPDNLTSRELINMIKDVRGEKANEDHLIKMFELGNYLDQNFRNLSGGTRQKINLVLALMFDSSVIILDEPTVGLDPVALLRFKELLNDLKEQGKTIILTTHIMSIVEQLSDYIVFLLEGKVYFTGAIPELLMSQDQTTLEKAIANIPEMRSHAENIQV